MHEVFGHTLPAVPVFAAKSYFGNLGAGGGTTELAASLLGLSTASLPPTLNYENARSRSVRSPCWPKPGP